MAENIRVFVLAAARQIGNAPNSGIREQKFGGRLKKYRSIIRGAYKIIYREDSDRLLIVDVFDTRQNPSKAERHT